MKKSKTGCMIAEHSIIFANEKEFTDWVAETVKRRDGEDVQSYIDDVTSSFELSFPMLLIYDKDFEEIGGAGVFFKSDFD